MKRVDASAFVMSGWPRGAADSARCSADVLPGSGLLLACPFRSLPGLVERWAPPPPHGKRGRGGAGETGEEEGLRKLEIRCIEEQMEP